MREFDNNRQYCACAYSTGRTAIMMATQRDHISHCSVACRLSSLFNPLAVPAPHLLSLFLARQPLHHLLLEKGLGTSAAYMSQTRDQQRFTISEVAADWHEPMVPQRIMWPSLPALTDSWTHDAASRHVNLLYVHTYAASVAIRGRSISPLTISIRYRYF